MKNVSRIISVFNATKSEVCDVAYLAISIYLLALTAGVTDMNVVSQFQRHPISPSNGVITSSNRRLGLSFVTIECVLYFSTSINRR